MAALWTPVNIIDHSLSDRYPYCCFGMVGGEHSDRGRKLVRRHWVMSELVRCRVSPLTRRGVGQDGRGEPRAIRTD